MRSSFALCEAIFHSFVSKDPICNLMHNLGAMIGKIWPGQHSTSFVQCTLNIKWSMILRNYVLL